MVFYTISKKLVSMIRKHNHTLWTNLQHCKEEPQNTNSHKTLEATISLFPNNVIATLEGHKVLSNTNGKTQQHRQWEQQ